MKRGQETNHIRKQEAGTQDTHDRGLTIPLFLQWKVYPLLSSHIKTQTFVQNCLDCFLLEKCLICAYFSPDSDETICFSMEKAMLWIEDSRHLSPAHWLEWCGLLVDYCDVFIGCLDSHSDGTHSLQRIHWWASDVMLHFSKSVMMEKTN